MTALELLRCAQCATPVALADAATVVCPGCGAEVAVPETHRAAFANERREQATRAEATALYAQLGRPPLALRAIGVAFAPSRAIPHPRNPLLAFVAWYYRVALVVIAPLAMLLLAILVPFFVMRGYGALTHANVMDTLSSDTRDWLILPFAFSAFLVGTALGVYGRRRAIAQHRLQACLAARPPSRAGGAAECRLCGAPLSIPDDALGVRCIYCGADNLVALPPAWINAVKRDVTEVAGAIDEAAAELAKERARLRRSLAWQLGISAGAIALFLAIELLTMSPRSPTKVPPSWGAFAGDPRPLVRRDRAGAHLTAAVTAVALDHGCATVPPAADDCDAHRCVIRLYAALRRGDRATITAAGPAHVRVQRHTGWPWPDAPGADFGPAVADLDAPASFTADWSAWHELYATVPAGGAPRLCVTVEPAR